MAETKDSFFGVKGADEGDDLRMVSTVVDGKGAESGISGIADLSIRLRVLDGETKQTRVVEIGDTKSWDWNNPEVWRVINGWQITSYGMLVSLLRQKQEKGMEEIEMLEAPRFTMLSGG